MRSCCCCCCWVQVGNRPTIAATRNFYVRGAAVQSPALKFRRIRVNTRQQVRIKKLPPQMSGRAPFFFYLGFWNFRLLQKSRHLLQEIEWGKMQIFVIIIESAAYVTFSRNVIHHVFVLFSKSKTTEIVVTQQPALDDPIAAGRFFVFPSWCVWASLCCEL